MKLLHITIQTAAFDKELDFFQTFAGLSVQRELLSAGRKIVFLGDAEGATEIEIIDMKDAPAFENEFLSIGFQADNLQAVHDQLSAAGFSPTPFISPVPQVRFFFVKDPAGVKVQFMG